MYQHLLTYALGRGLLDTSYEAKNNPVRSVKFLIEELAATMLENGMEPYDMTNGIPPSKDE